MQDEAPGTQIKEWQNEMDELCRDVRALHSESQDMNWLFCFNNPLTSETAVVNLPSDFKVQKGELVKFVDQSGSQHCYSSRSDPKALPRGHDSRRNGVWNLVVMMRNLSATKKVKIQWSQKKSWVLRLKEWKCDGSVSLGRISKDGAKGTGVVQG
ncbi:hypothetical protein J1N35_001325 [Gossypium stocksii]|uniref:Uncharacterized protein n=1 Tax=Gossypium stocksii TaxID=47602 RepID=A0A9D4AKX3_9ROSI|nr:hypothetical protein J1N35_001325 [Gossypium stocksii]